MKFYCEYHEHVRAIHLTITLPSLQDALTALDIYDRKTLRLRHAFQSYAIALPASVDPAQPLRVISRGLNISCRLPATPILKSSGINDVAFSSPEDLSSDLSCRCGTVLIYGRGVDWRRLPSEHWVEMMDSWHCHRGVTDEHHNEHHDQYVLPDHIVSATERIHARSGLGLIGLSYLLVHSSQMLNVKVSVLHETHKKENDRRAQLYGL